MIIKNNIKFVLLLFTLYSQLVLASKVVFDKNYIPQMSNDGTKKIEVVYEKYNGDMSGNANKYTPNIVKLINAKNDPIKDNSYINRVIVAEPYCPEKDEDLLVPVDSDDNINSSGKYYTTANLVYNSLEDMTDHNKIFKHDRVSYHLTKVNNSLDYSLGGKIYQTLKDNGKIYTIQTSDPDELLRDKRITGIISRSDLATLSDCKNGLGYNNEYQQIAYNISNIARNKVMKNEDNGLGKNNDVLTITGLGNRWNNMSYLQVEYNNSSKELQEIMRSDTMIAMINTNYYTDKDEITPAFNLRSCTISIENTKPDSSSCSIPNLAALAYKIKEKFPNLSYQQIKQLILTSGNNTEYLSNFNGWGILNENKALNGPSQFNAGLIDEQRFYNGWYNKIYDNEGRTYFYVDVPENDKYDFVNNITSGLTGNSFDGLKTIKNFDYTITNENTGLNDDPDKVYKHNTTLHLSVVLPSEKRFYKDQAQAGLRKAGKGRLYLWGKQLYTAHTQVLEGSLYVTNETNSTYEVMEGARLVIAPNTKMKDKKIRIRQLIVSGVAELGNNVIVDELIVTPTGRLKVAKGENCVFKNEENIIKETRIKHLVMNDTINKKLLDYYKVIIDKFDKQRVDFRDVIINPNLSEYVDKDVDRIRYRQDGYIALKDLPQDKKLRLMQYNPFDDKFENIANDDDIQNYELNDLEDEYIPFYDATERINLFFKHVRQEGDPQNILPLFENK